MTRPGPQAEEEPETSRLLTCHLVVIVTSGGYPPWNVVLGKASASLPSLFSARAFLPVCIWPRGMCSGTPGSFPPDTSGGHLEGAQY